MIKPSLTFSSDLLILERMNMKFRPLARQIISYTYRYFICIVFGIRIMDLNGIFMFKKKNSMSLNFRLILFL